MLPTVPPFSDPGLAAGRMSSTPGNFNISCQEPPPIGDLSSFQHGDYIAQSYLAPLDWDLSASNMVELPDNTHFHNRSNQIITETLSGGATEVNSLPFSLQPLQINQETGSPEEGAIQFNDFSQVFGNN
jgi:hypothetical protein